jgi:hypothetical protein
MKIGSRFKIDSNTYGKISNIFSLGFLYHTVDQEGNCLKGETYQLKDSFKFKIIE